MEVFLAKLNPHKYLVNIQKLYEKEKRNNENIHELFNKKAACLLTVVDSHYKKEELSALDRQNSLDQMTILALDSIL